MVQVKKRGGGGEEGKVGLLPFPPSPFSFIFWLLFLANYRPHLSHFLENVIFCDPNLVTFYLCIYLINVVLSSGM